MKTQDDLIRDISDMRVMMEKSSRFLSLSGWSGVFAGVFGLAAAGIASQALGFNPQAITDPDFGGVSGDHLQAVVSTALAALLFTVVSVIYFSKKRAARRSEKLWSPTSKRLLRDLAVPLVTGGLLAVVFLSKELYGLLAPTTLLFYGMAMYNAGRMTYGEIRVMGLIEIGLGLAAVQFVEWGLLLWAVGFGVVHIAYGIFLHYKYER
jgi:hypothetical protein